MPFGKDRRQRRRRVAAIGGAAVAAKKHHDAKQAEQEPEAAAASEQPAPDPAPAEPAAADGLTPQKLDELKQLGELHEQNVLSDEEFESEKAKLLGSA
jgi:putative oligomerization/nucleic acid binding protein